MTLEDIARAMNGQRTQPDKQYTLMRNIIAIIAMLALGLLGITAFGQDNCIAPTVTHNASAFTYIVLDWDDVSPEGYTVQWRPQDQAEWFSKNVFPSAANIGTMPASTWEYRVASNCDGVGQLWSDITTVNTPAMLCSYDIGEPNNLPTQATPLGEHGLYLGWAHAKISTADDVDWFQFTSTEPVRVKLYGAAGQLELYKRQGQSVASFNPPPVYSADGMEVVLNSPPNGNVQFRLAVTGLVDPSQCYTISVEESATGFAVPQNLPTPPPGWSKPGLNGYDHIGRRTKQQ